MLAETIRSRMIAAMKSGNTVERDVMRVVKGDLDTATARSGKQPTDEEAARIVRKTIEANGETIRLMEGETGCSTMHVARKQQLEKENEILNSLLPKTLTQEEIQRILICRIDDIKAAKNDGQATGIAVKYLKETGATALGSDVSAVVKKFRTPQ